MTEIEFRGEVLVLDDLGVISATTAVTLRGRLESQTGRCDEPQKQGRPLLYAKEE